jgi:5-methylcytosine-specific restriction endonuclease McrA
MLHDVSLSPQIREALTEGMRAQFRLLAYGVGRTALDRQECAAFLDEMPAMTDRGQALSDWLWKSEKRREALEDFAAHGVEREKREWVLALWRDAWRLLGSVPDTLTPLPVRAPAWQIAGATFLKEFYFAFSTERGLPGSLLGRTHGFGRQDFLRAFEDENHGLHVCSVCDEARVGTRYKRRIHADIDHFFPKTLYPHLSIHPFNLIPICHSCNSALKGAQDPLDDGAGGRLPLHDVAIPYRSPGFAGSTLLAVDVAAWRSCERPFTLQSMEGVPPQEHLDGLGRLLGVPGRWNQERTVIEIGDTLFRHVGQFLRADPAFQSGRADKRKLLAKLDQYLGVLKEENLRRDPLTFPMKWLLAHLVEDAQRDHTNAPFLKELRALVDARPSDAERQKVGATLRAAVRTSRGA